VAPEAVLLARRRVRANNVRFEVADVFSWMPRTQFDVIFFSAWLSHVPEQRFDEFWHLLHRSLADGGRVLFVDEPIENRDKESFVPGTDEIVERQLRDGSTYRVVKNFVDPEQLEMRLRGRGWECRLRRDDGEWVWIYGEARRTT
jgi:trans-aconitate methyltransferase